MKFKFLHRVEADSTVQENMTWIKCTFCVCFIAQYFSKTLVPFVVLKQHEIEKIFRALKKQRTVTNKA